MAVLHFKNNCDVFTPFVEQSKQLKIGLAAYKAYLDKKLLEATELIRILYDDDSSVVTDSGYTLSSYVPVAFTDADGEYRLAQTQIGALRDLVQGDGFHTSGYYCQPETEQAMDRVDLTLDDISSFLTDKVTCLQGQSVIFGAALKQNLNDAFDVTVLQAEMMLRGFSTSDYLQSVTANISNGITWIDLLTMISGGVKEPITDSNGYWVFNEDDFSNTNSIMLGLNSIIKDISSFFSEIKFSIKKIGSFFKQIWNGVVDLAKWLITMVAGDLLTDYVVKKDFSLEGLNIPFASVEFNLSSLQDDGDLQALITECQNNPLKGALCEGVISPSDNQLDGSQYHVFYSPDLYQLAMHAVDDIRDNSTTVIPWSRGFIMLVRKGDTATVYYFLGDFDNRVSFTNWSINSEYEISVKSQKVNHKQLQAKDFKTNSDFKDWFSSLFKLNQSGDKYTIFTDNNFIGNGPSTSGTSSIWDNALDLHVDLTNIEGPGSVVEQFKDYYYNGISDRLSAQLVLNALAFNNIFTNDRVRGYLKVTDLSFVNKFVVSNFDQTAFLPYQVNQAVTFKYYAQPDSERAAEMLDMLKKVVITAAAVGTAVLAVKVRKVIKKKASYAQFIADIEWQAAKSSPRRFDQAYAAQRKADTWRKISRLVGGATTNVNMSNAFKDFNLPAANNATAGMLWHVITGRELD